MTSKKIPKGSRIVVIIGIYNNPLYQINYGSGKDVSDETIADAAEPLHIQWLNGSPITIPLNTVN